MHNFNEYVERRDSGCVKYDGLKKYFHVEDAQPLWVADSDFKVAKPIEEAITKRAQHGIFGYGFAKSNTLSELTLKTWMKERHQLGH